MLLNGYWNVAIQEVYHYRMTLQRSIESCGHFNKMFLSVYLHNSYVCTSALGITLGHCG